MSKAARPPHRLAAAAPIEAYGSLFSALEAAGQRAGWLEHQSAAPDPLPQSLQQAAAMESVGRAVVVGPRGNLSWKRRRGPAVQRDVQREHFRGYRLVLVQGEDVESEALPRLEPAGSEGDEGWRVVVESEGGEGKSWRLSTAELISRLRKPDPWGLKSGSSSE